MIPRLEAAHSLRMLTAVAVAMGNTSPEESRAIVNTWEREAAGSSAPRARTGLTRAEKHAMMAGMKINVRSTNGSST